MGKIIGKADLRELGQVCLPLSFQEIPKNT